MYVKVRTVDGKQEVVLDLSKLTRIEELKALLCEKWSIEENLQKLFYRGKLLEDGYKLFDYNVNLNDVIQLMVKPKIDDAKESKKNEADEDKKGDDKKEEEESLSDTTSLYYEVGDKVDCLDREYGAWFEAIILRIFKRLDDIVYSVKWEFNEDEESFDVPENMIRPRAYRMTPFVNLDLGDRVMINHNIDEPEKDGFWYDFTISKIRKTKTIEELIGTLHVGNDQTVDGCKVKPQGEVFAIEEPQLLEKRDAKDKKRMKAGVPKRRRAVICDSCNDDQAKDCKECGCKVCGGKHDSHHLLLCDECNNAFHLQCLNPPLSALPTDDYWYCPSCKRDENEIVKAGGKKQIKKKIKEPSETKSKRDWGKGMACVGRVEECTIVPRDHRGSIPGVEVGMSWLFRIGVSQAGVHRPHVAGIHGRERDCAYSIVLSGGYEDDIDNGDEFMYTGSGGRDLSGNKRTAGQSCDQTLTRMNKALAINCNAKLNTKTGATSKDWKGGIPVRVVRKYNPREHKYAPKVGYRYDGIYKVVKYFPQKGKSGFSVWRYCLRRDDPSPAPWTKEGQERIAALGLELICPEGYEPDGEKEKDKKSRKADDLAEEEEEEGVFQRQPPKKKPKREAYKLEEKLAELIEEDTLNAKLWGDCREVLSEGKTAFLKRVSDRFLCVCCQELVYKPVTTPCAHNVCQSCLKSGFRAGVYSCPTCRHELEKSLQDQVNESLSSALLLLYPGYENTR